MYTHTHTHVQESLNVFVHRDEDIEVLAVDGGKGGDETSPNRLQSKPLR